MCFNSQLAESKAKASARPALDFLPVETHKLLENLLVIFA